MRRVVRVWPGIVLIGSVFLSACGFGAAKKSVQETANSESRSQTPNQRTATSQRDSVQAQFPKEVIEVSGSNEVTVAGSPSQKPFDPASVDSISSADQRLASVPQKSATESPTPTAIPVATSTSVPAPTAPAASPTPPQPFPAFRIEQVEASSKVASASLIIDGDTNSSWISDTVIDKNPFVIFSASQVSLLSEFKVKANPSSGAYSIDVQNAQGAWTSVAQKTNTTWNLETVKLSQAVDTKSFRLKFTDNAKAQVFELQIPGQTSTVTLTPAPTATDSQATPAPTTFGPSIIFVDSTKVLHAANSLLLGTNRNHVSSDFPNGAAKLEKMNELKPLWGQQKYLYRIGHGPTDGRHDYSYMLGYHFEQVWNKLGPYPYDDIREGLKEAAAIGAEQIHVINYGTGTPEEAGRYVSYLNKAADPNRALYPFAQQNVQYFELGNEVGWSRVRGHAEFAPNETVYAQRAKLFAQEMRRNSDIPIKIGVNGSINSAWLGEGWGSSTTIVKNILSIMGADVDFLIFHGYPSWPLYRDSNLTTIMAQNEWNRLKLQNEIKPAIAAAANGREIRIANTEFFTHLYGDVTRSRGLFGALYSADSVILAMNENFLSAVEFCFEHKEMADAAFFIGNDANNTTAIFKFQKMLAQTWGENVVESRGLNIPTVSVAGSSSSTVVSLPRLSHTAAVSADGQKLFVMVLNRLNDQDVTSSVEVGFVPSSVKAHVLASSLGWDAANADLSIVSNVALKDYVFPKASITILEISK